MKFHICKIISELPDCGHQGPLTLASSCCADKSLPWYPRPVTMSLCFNHSYRSAATTSPSSVLLWHEFGSLLTTAWTSRLCFLQHLSFTRAFIWADLLKKKSQSNNRTVMIYKKIFYLQLRQKMCYNYQALQGRIRWLRCGFK